MPYSADDYLDLSKCNVLMDLNGLLFSQFINKVFQYILVTHQLQPGL